MHIGSVIVLLGGVFYARFFVGDLAASFKKLAYVAIAAILISGVYAFLTKPSFPPYYHMVFGLKMLLALHIFAVTIAYRGKRRLLTGVVISGAVALALAEYLRWISLK